MPRNTIPADLAPIVALAVSPEGLAFLAAAVAGSQGRRNIVRFPHVNPFTGERTTR